MFKIIYEITNKYIIVTPPFLHRCINGFIQQANWSNPIAREWYIIYIKYILNIYWYIIIWHYDNTKIK